MFNKTHTCFDHERYSHRDGLWDIWKCSICGSEYTYTRRNPYDTAGKPLENKLEDTYAATASNGMLNSGQ